MTTEERTAIAAKLGMSLEEAEAVLDFVNKAKEAPGHVETYELYDEAAFEARKNFDRFKQFRI